MAYFKALKRKDSTELKPVWGKLETVLLLPEVTDQPQLWPADITMQQVLNKSSFSQLLENWEFVVVSLTLIKPSVVHNKQDIFQAIEKLKPAIMHLGVKRIGLFGSFAREEHTETSDIDLVVEFIPGMKKYRNFLDLADLLEETLQKKVDLLTWEGMASFVQREIEKDIEYVCFND